MSFTMVIINKESYNLVVSFLPPFLSLFCFYLNLLLSFPSSYFFFLSRPVHILQFSYLYSHLLQFFSFADSIFIFLCLYLLLLTSSPFLLSLFYILYVFLSSSLSLSPFPPPFSFSCAFIPNFLSSPFHHVSRFLRHAPSPPSLLTSPLSLYPTFLQHLSLVP